MKRSNTLYVYLGIFSALTVLGYCFDGYLGIWRQTIVGAALLAIGFCFLFQDLKNNPKSEKKSRSFISMLSVSCIIACGILVSISARLITTNLLAVKAPRYADVDIYQRVLATVLLPSIGATVLGFILFPCMTAGKGKWIRLATQALAFVPFCTHSAYIPAAILFGLLCGLCDGYLVKIRWEEIFVSYAVLLFYDTLSISLGSIDFNLSMRQAFSFTFISLSICFMLAYFSFRVCKERKIHIPELLTELLMAIILLCIGLAL